MKLRRPLRATIEASLTTDADRSSFFIALVVVDVLVGLADAISGPYIVLFLVDEARLGPVPLSAILTARALSGITFGTAFGTWVDRRTSVAPLLIALGGSSLDYALLAFTTNFAFLLVIAAVPIAIGDRRLFPIDRAHQTTLRLRRSPGRSDRRLGGGRSRVRLSRRLSRERSLGRNRPRNARLCAGKAGFQRGASPQPGQFPEWRSDDRARFSPHLPCFTPHCSWDRSRCPS